MDEIIYLSDDEEPMVILQNEDGINVSFFFYFGSIKKLHRRELGKNFST
jgi:hypothetical protein